MSGLLEIEYRLELHECMLCNIQIVLHEICCLWKCILKSYHLKKIRLCLKKEHLSMLSDLEDWLVSYQFYRFYLNEMEILYHLKCNALEYRWKRETLLIRNGF